MGDEKRRSGMPHPRIFLCYISVILFAVVFCPMTPPETARSYDIPLLQYGQTLYYEATALDLVERITFTNTMSGALRYRPV